MGKGVTTGRMSSTRRWAATAVAALLAMLAVGAVEAPAEARSLRHAARAVTDTAHRGLVGPMVRKGQDYADPNTVASCLNAIQHHVDACEFDVRFTSDNQPVVVHNRTLDATTNCTGPVDAMPLRAVKACRTAHGEHVPSLQTYLDKANGWSSTIKLNEDLKLASLTDLQLSRLRTINRSHPFGDRLRISNPSVDILRKIEAQLPSAGLILIAPGGSAPQPANLPRDVDTLLLNHKPFRNQVAADPTYVQRLHAAGFEVSVWGARALSDLKRLVADGVDEVVTNHADDFEDWRSR